MRTASRSAWPSSSRGKRRFTNGTDDTANTIASSTLTGFTGQEQMDSIALVNLNARLYDPALGRFMAADPLGESPFSTQGPNRYSYVFNNPLTFTDPTGMWSCCNFGKFFRRAFGGGLGKAVLAIAAVVTMQYYVLPALELGLGFSAVAVEGAAFTTINAGIAGGIGGVISTGKAEGFITGAITSAAFFGVGELTTPAGGAFTFGSGEHIANIAGHALVGCASQAASGGDCGAGTLSGGFGSLVTPIIPTNDFTGKLVTNAVVGGTASVLGGGKFENGAITASFGYLFNCSLHPGTCGLEDRDAIQAKARNCNTSLCFREVGADTIEAGLPLPFADPGQSLSDIIATEATLLIPGGGAKAAISVYGKRAVGDMLFRSTDWLSSFASPLRGELQIPEPVVPLPKPAFEQPGTIPKLYIPGRPPTMQPPRNP